LELFSRTGCLAEVHRCNIAQASSGVAVVAKRERA
jgi:hypothetical protein